MHNYKYTCDKYTVLLQSQIIAAQLLIFVVSWFVCFCCCFVRRNATCTYPTQLILFVSCLSFVRNVILYCNTACGEKTSQTIPTSLTTRLDSQKKVRVRANISYSILHLNLKIPREDPSHQETKSILRGRSHQIHSTPVVSEGSSSNSSSSNNRNLFSG